MKAIAGRPRDIADIEGIVDNTPKLDKSRIRLVVGELAAELGDSQLLDFLMPYSAKNVVSSTRK